MPESGEDVHRVHSPPKPAACALTLRSLIPCMPLRSRSPSHMLTPPPCTHTSTFEGILTPPPQGGGLSRMATAATSQEEDSELGMKAGEGWEEHPAGLHGGGWTFLGTQLLLPTAPQPRSPPRLPALPVLWCRGCRRAGAAGAEQHWGQAAPLQLEQTSFQTSSPARCHRFGGDCCRGEAWSARLIIVQIAGNANLGAPGEKCINNITPD